jgi:phosphate acetyl/butyryl transferase
VDISAATVLNPRTSELCDQFAAQYAELRKKKGVTLEQAREIMHDVSYFGTMLVHSNIVDGMVSGAAHTTAHTVRSAFEIIKTQADVSTVSSIFLMCLATRCSPTATARSSRIRPPNSPPLSRSRRHARPVRYRSPGWRCCPIPPVGRATAWLEIILAATDLVSWAKLIGFAADPDLATCEIDTFR